MADLLDYELAIGQTFFVLNLETQCIKKGVCRLVDIKIYLKPPTSENDSEVINEIKYLIETDSGETLMAFEKDVYQTFSEAAFDLQQSIDSSQ
jgi:hypothetical protein